MALLAASLARPREGLIFIARRQDFTKS